MSQQIGRHCERPAWLGFVITVLSIAGGSVLAVAGPTVARLELRDFTVRGLKEGMNLAEVQAVLGPPEGTIRKSDHGPGLEVSGWAFGELWVMAADSHSVTGFELRGPKYKTFRGLSVGDSVERIRNLYGTPDSLEHDTWFFYGPGNDRYHVLKIEVEAKKVTEIFLGWDL